MCYLIVLVYFPSELGANLLPFSMVLRLTPNLECFFFFLQPVVLVLYNPDPHCIVMTCSLSSEYIIRNLRIKME